MKRLTTLAMATVSVLALGTGIATAEYTLNILHINDLHSRIESINKYDSTCGGEDEAEGKCFGGVARLVTAVAAAREKMADGNVLFLNAGDNFQGSLFYTTYKGEAEAEFLNKMGTDVMTVGNHEFDDGEPGLASFLEKAEFPVVSANVLADYKSELGDRVKAYVVLERGGEKIGVVGAVANDTDELSSPGKNVLIADDVASITSAVEALQEEGVDKIIALTHVGYPRDLAAIAKIPGVDVVVGGHTNTLLSNTDENAVDVYPTMVDNPDGYQVPVVQAYAYGKYLGDLTVVFDDEGVVTSATGEPQLLDASVTPDQETLDRIAELAAPIEELKGQVIGETTEAIEGNRDVCRAMECQMGNLVADAILERVADQGIQVAIQNGGGLRASIDAGEVTMGEVLTVLPFQNTLATFQLKGSDVVAALENGVSQIEEGAGRFPQVAGLKYTVDPSTEPGSRISEVMVADGNGGYAPIEADATYGVASNNFMRGGGDGYSVFADNAIDAYDYGPGVEQVVADYLAENNPYTPYTDGRIQVAKAMSEEKPAEEAAVESEGETTADVTVDVPQTGLAATSLSTEAPPVAAEGAMEADAEAESAVKVPETGLAAGAIASEAPMVSAGENAAMDKKDSTSVHIVVRGDNFWELAKTYLGDAQMWTKLRDANPDVNPNALEVGAELVIPN
ncbi:5'-nucleotidase C-terminal domain-containing protein [Oricola cellulosilytica]|uniref:LysM peptidoglycan-binding domain-containing protein n=1 Tax=Oricola cellulosilytica TaxID=1429082 RepID=A0A4R0P4B3_9HYPH|nr:5'-nucleotidase C-terminal domain-containing protein [Oricola cellulosilytica]TCD11426.1 LysM peptidoglycan-binding domain-containing protein [Oricola cellulosilytica]